MFEDTLQCVAIVFKIMNLEDDGKFDSAKILMESAFNGKLGSNIRKLYSLSRAGYLDGFVMDVLYSPANHGLRRDDLIEN